MANATTSAKRYQYRDYLTWPADQRWELIDGVPVAMVPAPSTRHQAVQQNLAGLLFNHFRGKICRPFHAPVDVKLSEHDVIQPDLLVVCDPKKITEGAIVGIPDLVIEITSPSTEARDRREKRALYESNGLAEYWIVSQNGFIEQLTLQSNGRFGDSVVANVGESFHSTRFPELVIAVEDVFEGLVIESRIGEALPPAFHQA